MPSSRIPARLLMTEAELVKVRTRSPWRGLAMVAHAWGTIFAAMAVAVIWPNPLTIVLAIMIIGSRQLGLAILMHEGAHGLLTPNTRVSLWVSQWLCAYPVVAETLAYRRSHLKHHANTQTEDDPNLGLSAPYPITEASYRRKFWRDVSGQTGYQQRKAQILNAFGPSELPWRERLARFDAQLGRQALAHGVLLVALTAVAGWWVYPVLWLGPLLTWMMVVTRIRNIAEHAVVPDDSDPLRNTRTTIVNRLERLFVAPYYVNYHLEHHLLYYVPAYSLPRVHAILMAGPYAARMEVETGYRAILRKALSKPAHEDAPGVIASAARRMSAGQAVSADSATTGF